MSIIDNILIAIDDDTFSKNDLEKLFPTIKTSVLFSGLGRLVSKNLVKDRGKGYQRTYEITKLGSEKIESALVDLKKLIEKKPSIWLLVSVSIEEKYKVDREKLRIEFKKRGFGLVKNGLFIGSVYNQNSFKKIIQNTNTKAKIIYFHINELPDQIINNPENHWNIKNIKKDYKNWSNEAEKFKKNLPKQTNVLRIKAKSLIYELSNIMMQEPKIKDKKIADSIGRSNAIKLYQDIRDYCYTE